MENRLFKKIATLGVLYFVQGLPYGFQDKFIPSYLRSSGLSHTELSLMKLLLLPWLCKAVFAPFLDLFWTKWFWLLCSLGGLSFISLLGALIQPENFTSVSMWLFLLNLLTAVQDIAVDGLALKILRDGEIGYGNSAQVLGYKLGALSGGGFLFWFHFYFGWSGLCTSLFAFYLVSIFAILPIYEKTGISDCDRKEICDNNTEIKNDDYEEHILKEGDQNLRERRKMSNDRQQQSATSVKENAQRKDFLKVFTLLFDTKGTFPLIFFLLIYKLGERGALSTFPLFLLDKGATQKQLSIWSGIIGQSSSLVGSLFSGWCITRKRKIVFLLAYIFIARSFPVILQWIVISIWSEHVSGILYQILFGASVISLIALEFCAGMATTAIFSLMMSASLKAPEQVQGTHYSLLSSVEVAGKLVFSSVIGALIDWFGLPYIYFILSVLSVSTVAVIPLLN